MEIFCIDATKRWWSCKVLKTDEGKIRFIKEKEFQKDELPNWLAKNLYDGSVENAAPYFVVNDEEFDYGSRIDNDFFTLID